MSPVRVQLSRRAGWRLPPNTRSVAYPSKFANPHRPTSRSPEANAAAVERYRAHLRAHPELVAAIRDELAGVNVACWCPLTLPCHGDDVLAVAAGEDP
ncbi:MAG TPA: DUF4326 domain-containing protein [Nocardioidaceae bacterium]